MQVIPDIINVYFHNEILFFSLLDELEGIKIPINIGITNIHKLETLEESHFR